MPGLAAQPGTARRADAGTIRLQQRDITGLLLCAEHYAAPYDLLASALAVAPARLRGIVARWRAAGFAATGTLWSPEPVHPAIISQQTWEEAQHIGAGHSSSRDTGDRAGMPVGRLYPYRGRVRCKACRRRMAANTSRYITYYRCPHNPANPATQPPPPATPAACRPPNPS